MRRLSPTQRELVISALEDQEPDFFLRACVYSRNLQGLIRIGAVVVVDGHYVVSDAARAQVEESG